MNIFLIITTSLLCLFFLSVIIRNVSSQGPKDAGYSVEEKNGELTLTIENKNSPVHKIVSKVKNDLRDGNGKIFFRDGSSKSVKYDKDVIVKDLTEKKNVANIILGNDIIDIIYQDKYGCCCSLSKSNPSGHLSDIIHSINSNDNIDTIKIQLYPDGSMCAGNFRKILDTISNDCVGANNIVINDMRDSHFIRRKADDKDIMNAIKDNARKHTDTRYFYQKNKNDALFHWTSKTVDKKNNIAGLLHSPFEYFQVKKDGSFNKISKKKKYSLLNTNSDHQLGG